MHEKKLFLLDTTKESRRKRNQSVCWLKEGHKLEDLRTMLDVLCDNDIPGSVWFTFIRAGIGQQRASDQLQQSLTLLNKKSIQLPGFTFPNKSPLWVSSMGYQAHSNIKYFNCHISLSSLSLSFFFSASVKAFVTATCCLFMWEQITAHLGMPVLMHRAPSALLQQQQRDASFCYKTRGCWGGFGT